MSSYSNYDLSRTKVLGYGASVAVGLIGAGTFIAGLIAHHVVVAVVGGGIGTSAVAVAGFVQFKLLKMKEANEQSRPADRTITYNDVKPNSTVVVGDGRNCGAPFEQKDSTPYIIPLSSTVGSSWMSKKIQ